jgi:molybdopterin converting factor small subunit
MQHTIPIRVRLFAAPAQMVGASFVDLSVPVQSVKCWQVQLEKVIAQLCHDFPELHELVHQSRWALGNEFIAADHWITADHVLALIPPVSGG